MIGNCSHCDAFVKHMVQSNCKLYVVWPYPWNCTSVALLYICSDFLHKLKGGEG